MGQSTAQITGQILPGTGTLEVRLMARLSGSLPRLGGDKGRPVAPEAGQLQHNGAEPPLLDETSGIVYLGAVRCFHFSKSCQYPSNPPLHGFAEMP